MPRVQLIGDAAKGVLGLGGEERRDRGGTCTDIGEGGGRGGGCTLRDSSKRSSAAGREAGYRITGHEGATAGCGELAVALQVSDAAKAAAVASLEHASECIRKWFCEYCTYVALHQVAGVRSGAGGGDRVVGCA